MENKTGIRQIARKAGVSTATVSRVLNGTASVRLETHNKVMNAVEEANYRPNSAAKALATNRTRTIAAVIPTLEHSIFAVFMNALEDRLASLGYNLVIATHGFDPDAEYKRCDDVVQLGAEAVVLSGANQKPELMRMLKNSGVACLLTSVYEPDHTAPSIGYDNRDLAQQAIAYLRGLGHTNIHVLHSDTTYNDRMAQRVEGIKLSDNLFDDIQITLHKTELGVTGGAQKAQRLFTQSPLPDAILCCADVFAMGAIFQSIRNGIAIPKDVSLMGFEDLDWANSCEPRLTTIALPAAEMGITTANALVAHLDHGNQLIHQLLTGKIIARESTCRKATS